MFETYISALRGNTSKIERNRGRGKKQQQQQKKSKKKTNNKQKINKTKLNRHKNKTKIINERILITLSRSLGLANEHMVMELGFIWSVEFNIKTEKRSLYGKQEAQFSIRQNLYIVRVLASDYTDFDIAVNLAQL